MKWQIWFAFKDVKRNIVSVIFAGISIGIVSTMLVIVFTQYSDMIKARDFLSAISDMNISYFDVDYIEKESANDFQLHEDLEKILHKNAYSHIMIPHEYNENVNYIFLFGDYKWLNSSMKKMKEDELWIGSNVNEKIFPLIEERKWKYMPEDVTMFSTKGTILNLNNCVVVPISFKEYTRYTTFLTSDVVLTNMLLFNLEQKEKQEVVKIINDNAGQECDLVDLNDTMKVKQENIEKSTIMYSLYFLSTLFLTLISVILNTFLIIDKNIKEYVIHLLCGSSILKLLLRISIFSMILLQIGNIVAFYFYHYFFARTPFDIRYMLIINVFCFLLMLLCLWKKLSNKMISEEMRGDF